MKTCLLLKGSMFCGETIVPKGMADFQRSFNFIKRKKTKGGNV